MWKINSIFHSKLKPDTRKPEPWANKQELGDFPFYQMNFYREGDLVLSLFFHNNRVSSFLAWFLSGKKSTLTWRRIGVSKENHGAKRKLGSLYLLIYYVLSYIFELLVLLKFYLYVMPSCVRNRLYPKPPPPPTLREVTGDYLEEREGKGRNCLIPFLNMPCTE